MATAKKLPSGNWRVQVFVGVDENQKRIYKSFTAPTKKQAEYAAAEYLLYKKEGKKECLSFNQALAAYIDSKSNVLSPSTICGYNRLKKYGYANCGDIPIDELTTTHIQNDINAYALSHSPKSVRNYYGLLSAVLKQYRPDFTPVIRLPQKAKRQFVIPTKDVIQKIYEHIKGSRLELPFLLASQCGLRASEIAGLARNCVDKKSGIITIKQARVAAGKVHVVKQPKSFAGNRKLPCSDYICELALSNNGEFVTDLNANQISKYWLRDLRKLKEKGIISETFNFHALRHYFASQAMLQGIPQKYIAELMGHSSLKMLDEVYQHTFPDVKMAYAEIMKKQSECITSHENSHDNN